MRNFKKLLCVFVAGAFVLSIAGCQKKTSSIYDSAPESSVATSSVESTTSATESTGASSETTGATQPTETTQQVITAANIIANCKSYIKSVGCLEQTTDVECTSTRTSGGSTSSSTTTATLESGFNPSFYYIKETSETKYNGTSTPSSKKTYVFCIDNNWGMIKFDGSEYKILTSIVLDECELNDLSVDTLSQRFLDSLILDLDYCTLSEDDTCYIIEQRLSYGDLYINKANSCQFYQFDQSTSIRMTLKFDKQTFALISTDVTSTKLDVQQGEEVTLTVHSEYKYTQSYTYDSSTLGDMKEIDSFKGYSIY